MELPSGPWITCCAMEALGSVPRRRSRERRVIIRNGWAVLQGLIDVLAVVDKGLACW